VLAPRPSIFRLQEAEADDHGAVAWSGDSPRIPCVLSCQLQYNPQGEAITYSAQPSAGQIQR
jgi:hypothetical protein